MKLKEVKFGPRTEEHDLGYKTRHIREFLAKGHKVRVVVQMRGRELAHPEVAQKMMENVIGRVGECGVGPIRNEGRQFSCELRP